MPTIDAEIEFPDWLLDQGRGLHPVADKQHYIIGKALLEGPLADIQSDLIDNIWEYPKDFAPAVEVLRDALGSVGKYPAIMGGMIAEAMYVACCCHSEVPVQITFDVEPESQGKDPEGFRAENIGAVIAGVDVNLERLSRRDFNELEMQCESWIEDHWERLARKHREDWEDAYADHKYQEYKDRRLGL